MLIETPSLPPSLAFSPSRLFLPLHTSHTPAPGNDLMHIIKTKEAGNCLSPFVNPWKRMMCQNRMLMKTGNARL